MLASDAEGGVMFIVTHWVLLVGWLPIGNPVAALGGSGRRESRK